MCRLTFGHASACERQEHQHSCPPWPAQQGRRATHVLRGWNNEQDQQCAAAREGWVVFLLAAIGQVSREAKGERCTETGNNLGGSRVTRPNATQRPSYVACPCRFIQPTRHHANNTGLHFGLTSQASACRPTCKEEASREDYWCGHSPGMLAHKPKGRASKRRRVSES